MAVDPLRVAIVGCGRIGTYTEPALREKLAALPGRLPLCHADAIAAVDGLQLVALCDPHADNLRRAAELHGVDACFADYRELLATHRPEIISIATRTEVRPAIIDAALDHGVRGLHIEKPLARTFGESDRLISRLEATGARLTYGTIRRFTEGFLRARAAIRDGAIGELQEITLSYGRTILMWNYPHLLDLLVFFAGSDAVTDVQGTCTIADGRVTPGEVDDDPLVEHGYVRFANGVSGIISASGGQQLRLAGSEGTITIAGDGGWLRRESHATPGEVEQEEIHPTISGTQRAFQQLHDAVRHDHPVEGLTPHEIRLSQQLLFMLVHSSLQGGRRLSPDALDPQLAVTGRFGDLHA